MYEKSFFALFLIFTLKNVTYANDSIYHIEGIDTKIGVIEDIYTEIKVKEKRFRDQYKHVDIPELRINREYIYLDSKVFQMKQHFENIRKNIALWAIFNQLSLYDALKNIVTFRSTAKPIIGTRFDFNHFVLLHEIGHHRLSEIGFNSFNIHTPLLALTLFNTINLLAMRLKALSEQTDNGIYKNRIDKILSLNITSCIIVMVSNYAHELYADNFACTNIKTKEELEKGIAWFKNSELAENLYYENLNFLQKTIYNIRRKLFDPHPNTASRIAKMEQTLKTRFANS